MDRKERGVGIRRQRSWKGRKFEQYSPWVDQGGAIQERMRVKGEISVFPPLFSFLEGEGEKPRHKNLFLSGVV